MASRMAITIRVSKSCGSVKPPDEGAGAVVLLLPGVAQRAEAWEPQIAALAATHRVIAADLPGHGASDPLVVGTPSLPDYAAWAKPIRL